MNKIFFLILLFLATTTLHAQSKMANFYNSLPKENKQDIVIKQKSDKYIAFDEALEVECKLILDEKNGFLQIVNNGTGGGTNTIQLAQFKDASGNVTLALSVHIYDGVMHESKINFFSPNNKMEEVTGKVFGFDIPSGAFQKEDFKETAENQAYMESEYFYYELPREGLVMKMYHGYNGAELDCNAENNPNACEFISHFAPFLSFKWNKTAAKFEQLP
jgi:hypothetical protein